MNQDFENDNLSDISGDDEDVGNGDNNVRFSGHDGLVYTDKRGNIIKKSADLWDGSEIVDLEDDDESDDSEDNEKDGEGEGEEGFGTENDDTESEDILDMDSEECTESSHSLTTSDKEMNHDLVVNTKVLANYRVDEQFENRAAWYHGIIRKVYCDESSGNVLYDVDYDDGDFEEGVRRENIKMVQIESEEETQSIKDVDILQSKRTKAVERARSVLLIFVCVF